MCIYEFIYTEYVKMWIQREWENLSDKVERAKIERTLLKIDFVEDKKLNKRIINFGNLFI